MRPTWVGIDRGTKAWHSKVAREAAVQVSALLGPALPEIELWAEFDVSEPTTVRLVERRDGDITFFVVRFAAARWIDVRQAIASACPQLAAAMLFWTRGPRGEVEAAFRVAGYTLPPVAFSRERRPGDSRKHLVIAFDATMPQVQFLGILDVVEARLARSCVGDVTGTGHGLLGWTIDVATDLPQECIADLESEFAQHSLSFRVL